MPETEKTASEGCGKLKEHFVTVFPFQVIEKIIEDLVNIWSLIASDVLAAILRSQPLHSLIYRYFPNVVLPIDRS